MIKRIITAVVAFAILVPFLIFSGSPSFVFIIMTALLSAIAVFEVSGCAGFGAHPVIRIVLSLASAGVNVLARYAGSDGEFFAYTAIILFFTCFYLFVCATFSKGRIKVVNASVLAAMTVYITLAFSMLTLLRDFEIDGAAVGGKIYLLAFLFAWMPDTGGYFAGRFFGKHKLIPDVSPKKTVEGFIGGIVFALVAGVVYSLCITENIGGIIAIAVASLICAPISVCGDLVASLVKRHYGIKDYGKIFPGHGGIMDRFDSVIAVAPVLYIIAYIARDFGVITATFF